MAVRKQIKSSNSRGGYSSNERSSSTGDRMNRGVRTKKVCMFCTNKTEPTYTDSSTLKKFMSDRARIYSKQKTGTCSKHQRKVTAQIKYGRHLALLPFIATI